MQATETKETGEIESSLAEQALRLHERYEGKVGTQIKIPLRGLEDLALAYSPGVAAPCHQIARNPAESFRYTARGNTVAVVSSGSAVLGLGDIGPAAALPVMEGKALLFKHFAGLDAVPLCIACQDTEQIIAICAALEPSFGGINLEDIAAPDCVTIERELQRRLAIPVFHDDQHGTAIVCAAALRSAAQVTGRCLEQMRIVISGLGAAGSAIARLLHQFGAAEIYGSDISGPLWAGAPGQQNFVVQELFAAGALSQPSQSQRHSLAALLRGADAFVGVSAAGIVSEQMVRSMAPRPIVLALANPDPEIRPEAALRAGAAVVGSGRMDYPNQINNLLAFPSVFAGALRAQRERAPRGLATRIGTAAIRAAAIALAEVLPAAERSAERILPSPMDSRVVPQVSAAVYRAIVEAE